MFQGTTSGERAAYIPFTGLASAKLMAVNPTKSQIEELTGRDYPLDVVYDKREDLNGNQVRPIEFWVKISENNIIDKVSFQIGNVPVKSQTGNYQFINEKGVTRYAPSIEEANTKYEKHAPFVRPLLIGENALYAFMQRVLGKPADDNARFLNDCIAAGITPENIFEGNIQGLKDFVEFVNSKNRKVGVVLAVKQKEKVDGEGNKSTQNRQVIINNPDFFFTLAGGKVDDYNLNRLQEVIKEKVENGASLGTALFTVKLQKFVESECENFVPANPSSSNITWG